jgi:hypothetical protein
VVSRNEVSYVTDNPLNLYEISSRSIPHRQVRKLCNESSLCLWKPPGTGIVTECFKAPPSRTLSQAHRLDCDCGRSAFEQLEQLNL